MCTASRCHTTSGVASVSSPNILEEEPWRLDCDSVEQRLAVEQQCGVRVLTPPPRRPPTHATPTSRPRHAAPRPRAPPVRTTRPRAAEDAAHDDEGSWTASSCRRGRLTASSAVSICSGRVGVPSEHAHAPSLTAARSHRPVTLAEELRRAQHGEAALEGRSHSPGSVRGAGGGRGVCTWRRARRGRGGGGSSSTQLTSALVTRCSRCTMTAKTTVEHALSVVHSGGGWGSGQPVVRGGWGGRGRLSTVEGPRIPR